MKKFFSIFSIFILSVSCVGCSVLFQEAPEELLPYSEEALYDFLLQSVTDGLASTDIYFLSEDGIKDDIDSVLKDALDSNGFMGVMIQKYTWKIRQEKECLKLHITFTYTDTRTSFPSIRGVNSIEEALSYIKSSVENGESSIALYANGFHMEEDAISPLITLAVNNSLYAPTVDYQYYYNLGTGEFSCDFIGFVLDQHTMPEDFEALQQELQDAVQEKADSILSSNENASKLQLYRSAHDAVVRSCSYDHNMSTFIENNESTDYGVNYGAYGALISGKTVCRGYAQAYKLLCDSLNLPCWLVFGDAGYNGDYGSHAWNIILLDNTYYIVDCTWDDSLGSLEYFLCSINNNNYMMNDFCLYGW